MIRIWHDNALRWMPLWLPITMLNTSVLLGVVLWKRSSDAGDPQPPTSWLLLILWLAIAFYIVFGHVRTRCQPIEMSLPIPSVALWRRHLAAVFLAGTVVMAGSLAVLALHAALLAKIDRQPALHVPYSVLIGPLLGGLLLAAAIVNSVDPALQQLRGRPAYWARVAVGLVGIPVLLLALLPWPWASSALCLLLAVVLSGKTLGSLPSTYRLVPMTPSTAAMDTPDRASTEHSRSRLQVYRTLFNIVHTAPPWKQLTPWMIYGFSALMGFVLAGGIDRWKEVPEIRVLYLPFGSYMLFAGIGVLSYNLYRLDPLPVPRKALLAVLTLPGMLFYCAGYAAGWWSQATAPESSPPIDFKIRQIRVDSDGPGRQRELKTMVWVDVQPRHMKLLLGGEPPRLTTPWGESHDAWSESLFEGSSLRIYNPYNTSEETSADFEALMLSRAISDVYGQAIPPQELRERYFIVENDQLLDLAHYRQASEDFRQGRLRAATAPILPLFEDYPDLEIPTKGPETAVYMLLVLVPSLLLTAVFLRSFRADHSSRFIRGVYWAGLAIPMLGLLAQAFLSVFGLFSLEAARGFLEIPIRFLGSHPISWLLTWIVVAAAILASYWLALRQLLRAEIPASPINCSLVKWGTED